MIILISGGMIASISGDESFLSGCISACKLLFYFILSISVLFVPQIALIRWYWKRKKLNIKNEQTKKAIGKFISNANALAGSLTLCYAFLLFIFAHILAPDKSPFANDQINELTFKEPGFSIHTLKIPIEMESPSQTLLSKLINGKHSKFRELPLNSYSFKGDSIIISRYIGEEIPGENMQFLMSNITEKNLSPEENKQLLEHEFIKTKTYYFGTDDLGRDYLSRIILGIRVSLSVGFVAVLIALFIGVPYGAIAGYYKKEPPQIIIKRKKITDYQTAAQKSRKIKIPVDSGLQWIMQVIWAVPTLLLVFPIVFAFGQNYYTIFIAVGFTMWVDIARIVRGQVILVRESEFIQAAQTFGFSDFRIIFKHILPNIVAPVIVITAANFAYAILTEAGLSFLGIGVQPPAPSWGLLISKYKDNLFTNPYLALLPGFAITLLVLAFFMVGNGLRDALDVKMKITAT